MTQKSPFRLEKEDLLEKLFNELKKDEKIICENLMNVMENIMLVAKSKNYEAVVRISLIEKNEEN